MEQYKDDPDRPKVSIVQKKESNPLDSRIVELENKVHSQSNEIEKLYRELGRMKNHINILSKALSNVR